MLLRPRRLPEGNERSSWSIDESSDRLRPAYPSMKAIQTGLGEGALRRRARDACTKEETSMQRSKAGVWVVAVLMLAAAGFATAALASSHREAPLITEMPKVDGTDFYMFRSYETGRANYVTFLANYIPIQAPYGGPNFYELDADARYQINIENDGSAGDDLVFEFRFFEAFQDQK